MQAPALQIAGKDAPAASPLLAGKIDAAPGELAAAVERWLAYLGSHGRSRSTLRAWRGTITADLSEGGLVSLADLNFENITGLLARVREERGWSASTYRVHLSAWKSLDRHIKQVRDGNIQAAEGPMDDDTGMGERAATVEEARAHLAAAWEQERGDGRARSPRTIYTACLFLAGLREDEPHLWRWEHLRLEGPHPFIAWTPDIQKNKRRQDVAIVAELAELLRAWTARRFEGDQKALVFPVKPPRDVFRKDRARAGILESDDRGRRYAPRSARKFFKTMLVLQGLEKDWSELFMRHVGLAERYVDVPPQQQTHQLSTFPKILPADAQALVATADNRGRAKKMKKTANLSPGAGETCDDVGATPGSPMCTTETSRISTLAQPSGRGVAITGEGRDSSCFAAGPSGPTDEVGRCAPALAGGNGRYQRASADSKRAAELLKAVARFLETGAEVVVLALSLFGRAPESSHNTIRAEPVAQAPSGQPPRAELCQDPQEPCDEPWIPNP